MWRSCDCYRVQQPSEKPRDCCTAALRTVFTTSDHCACRSESLHSITCLESGCCRISSTLNRWCLRKYGQLCRYGASPYGEESYSRSRSGPIPHLQAFFFSAEEGDFNFSLNQGHWYRDQFSVFHYVQPTDSQHLNKNFERIEYLECLNTERFF